MAPYWIKLDIDGNNKSLTNHVLVLDLDETLIHSFENVEDIKKLGLRNDPELRGRIHIIELEDVVSKKGQGKTEKMYFVTRPGLDEFIVFCFRYFKKVVVWSAGRRIYVRAIVNKIFSHINEPNIVFTYDECLNPDGECNDKPLEKLYKLNPEIMSEKNTLLLDDRIHNFEPNPDNGVLIPPYLPVVKKDIKKSGAARPDKKAMLSNEDNCLKLFSEWLMKTEVIESKDVRLFDKTNIFPKKFFIPNY